MKNKTLEDISQEDFDAAAETVIAGIKAYNRKLDTRVGTVLRDLLVNPEAAVESVISSQIGEVRKCSSLKMMQEAQESGEDIDQDDVNAIMSNFNLTPRQGTHSKGIIKIVVSDGTVSYSVAHGATFSTAEGLTFASDDQVIAALASAENPGVSPTTVLYKGSAGYFFLVPATAVDVGSSGNIEQGTSLDPESRVPSFVMAEAYKDFCGGSDTQNISDIVKSIPTGLSIRGFVNRTASEGMLRDAFDAGDHPIVAVSSVGYGNQAQLRDKHNVFGVGVGGRIDLYVRNFTDAYTVTDSFVGKKIVKQDGTVDYVIDVPPGKFPGACWIKSVSDIDTTYSDTEESVLGSLAFTAERTADTDSTWHDISSSNVIVESFNTIWQGFSIVLNDVPADIQSSESDSGESEWSDNRIFKVTAYCMPQAGEMQAYVDRDDIRSISTDVVVRCPIVCSISVNAIVKYDPKNPIDESVAKTQIRTYVNGLGFVGRITRSEIVQIIKNLGAVSVDMQNDDMLVGELHDAKGVRHVLSGDALDVSSIEDGSVMLSKDTVVFCVEESNIQIKLIPNA